MKLHRFYLGDTELPHEFWMQDKALFHQWTNVLRFQIDREVILFNENHEEKLYRIEKIGDNAVHLSLITELVPKIPKNDVYLCFSLLKKDKNDWILQKATELGVKHFLPMICDRTEKTGFDIERAEKIVIEASEQCGRADIPRVREPIHLEKVIEELAGKVNLYVAEQGGTSSVDVDNSMSKGVLIGPEGGWTESEKQLFKDKNLNHISLSEFTLRAETAVVASSVLLNSGTDK